MPITSSELDDIKQITLPDLWTIKQDTSSLAIRHLSQAEATFSCKLKGLRTVKGLAVQISAELDAGYRILIEKRKNASSPVWETATHALTSRDFTVSDGLLSLTKAIWDKHPLLSEFAPGIAAKANASWAEALHFRQEVRTNEVVSAGFRPPQIGALHAVAAHWSISNKPALVVMPTGTGKTEVMLACMLMRAPKRLLVLVPSDALRAQTVNKFIRLGVLPQLGVLNSAVINPVVGMIRRTFRSKSDVTPLQGCNVIVSTVAAIQGVPRAVLRELLGAFDAVFFDEAHHLPALSWERISDALKDQTVLQFTATPFRLDGRRIPGRIIYNFPLRLAQSQGYFRKIHFKEIYEHTREQADIAIAQKAVQQLRDDLAAGYDHVLLARTERKEQAEGIFNDIYAAKYSDLKPVLIHSGIRGRRKLVQAIKTGIHKIIVCVDMFGEGFDMPSLKVGALHDPHKSLAITLQFTGRFTRTARKLGDATLVANTADPRVSDAIEELYAEDSDWNEIIPELSAKAIQSQQDFSDFLERMVLDERSDEDIFGLNVLHPKTSTVIFRANSFNARQFHRVAQKGVEIVREWHSRDKDLSIFITRSKVPIEWASIKEASDEIWDLYVFSYEPTRRLLFIHSSQKGSLHQEVARAVGGASAELLSGERMFRALHGVNRLLFHNVGLYNKGTKLRFRMYTGLDIGDAITPLVQSGSTKSNLFAVGYHEGQRTSVGVSSKGRLWSMSSSSIPDWRKWCSHIATKILDETIPKDEFLRHTLIPQEIKTLPLDKQLFFVSLPTEWYSSAMEGGRLFESGAEQPFHSFGITSFSIKVPSAIDLGLSFEGRDICTFSLSWGPTEGQFSVMQHSGPTIEIHRSGIRQRLDEFFREAPPVLFFMDGSEIAGARMLSITRNMPFTYDTDNIAILDWDGVDIKLESKWKTGKLRPTSIQARLIEFLRTQNNQCVIDDDDSGEVADVVEITETANQEVLFRFYHCKYSGGDVPGLRVKDTYEVCAQAARSVRWTTDSQRLVMHLLERDQPRYLHGRKTRFEKGDSRYLAGLKRRLRKLRHRYQIVVVQPGVSKGMVEPEMATIFGSANAIVTEITGSPLRIIASA